MSPHIQIPMAPIYVVDILGAALMILLSAMCVGIARGLCRRDPENLLWTYLLWLSSGLLIFSLSRSGSHLVKYVLLALELDKAWIQIRPITGSLNSLSFVLVGAITLFFSQIYATYQRMGQDKATIQGAHQEILALNANLERIVAERTRDLSASEEKYRRLFEGSRDMVFICDGQGRLLDINQAGWQLLGAQEKEELLGRDLLERVLPTDNRGGLLDRLQHRDFVSDLEVVLRRDGAEDSIALLAATVRRNQVGIPERIEGILKDISSRRWMERQLLQADKLASLGQLSAGVAHEINNPLGLILGYTQLLLRDLEPQGQVAQDLKVIEKHAQHCKRIVEDLLKFSRSSGTTKTQQDINGLLQEVLAVVRSKFELERVKVVEELASGLPRLTLDGDKMKQVFMNLLMNARQSIAGEGSITVRTALNRRRDRVLVSFQDTGCGIPPEILHRIFDPFFTTKPVGVGTGLGLSVSYGIVRNHEGEIRVETAVGKGSTFIVELPVETRGEEP